MTEFEFFIHVCISVLMIVIYFLFEVFVGYIIFKHVFFLFFYVVCLCEVYDPFLDCDDDFVYCH